MAKWILYIQLFRCHTRANATLVSRKYASAKWHLRVEKQPEKLISVIIDEHVQISDELAVVFLTQIRGPGYRTYYKQKDK